MDAAAEDVFASATMVRKIKIQMADVTGGNLDTLMLQCLKNLEGKCTTEGFVKSGSIQILQTSAKKMQGDALITTVEFEAQVALPVKGQCIDCIVDSCNRAGITCRVKNARPTPFQITVFCDNHHTASRLEKYGVDKPVTVRVVAFRYEENDPTVTVIGELHDGITENADVEAPVWTTEQVDAVTLSMVQSNPKKTFVVNSAHASKEVRSMPNVIQLHTKGFTSTPSHNRAIIDRFIQDLHSNHAKTIVFPKDFAEQVRVSDHETHRYLLDHLCQVGFRVSQRAASPTPSEEADSDDY
jgi:hypothetical protein